MSTLVPLLCGAVIGVVFFNELWWLGQKIGRAVGEEIVRALTINPGDY